MEVLVELLFGTEPHPVLEKASGGSSWCFGHSLPWWPLRCGWEGDWVQIPLSEGWLWVCICQLGDLTEAGPGEKMLALVQLSSMILVWAWPLGCLDMM